jgi:hypothetical protein
MSMCVDLKTAKHGHIDMSAADQTKGHRAVEGKGARQRTDRASAGIRQQGMRHSLLWDRTGADQSVFRLKEHLQIRRNVVGDQRRNADAQVDEIAALEHLGEAPGDDGLSHPWVTRS